MDRGRGRGFHYRGGRGGPSGGSAHSAHAPLTDSAAGGGRLVDFFRSVDGANYGALKQLTSQTFPLPSARCEGLTLTFLAVQSDPFAPGSQIAVRLPTPFRLPRAHSEGVKTVLTEPSPDLAWVGLARRVEDPAPGAQEGDPAAASAAFYDGIAQVAAEDYLLRCLRKGLARVHGSGTALQCLKPSQHVLPRSAVALDGEHFTETRLHLRVKLPGHGRRIDGRGAINILMHQLLPLLESYVCDLDTEALAEHVRCVQDQEWLRHQLRTQGLVAFIADNAILPRATGDQDSPLPNAIPFVSPPSLSTSFVLPFSGATVTGMGLPRGLTLIAGGGFHGKSTLLRALELGIYNHVPRDGREFVVTDPTAVKIRAEDRRSIHGVDISPFIGNLPFQKDTTAFVTADASGSTSQAANIMEALEMGCTALLLDEDTSATNFMYRDALMQQLVPPAQEPITPFVERVRELVQMHDVSAIMVVGGSGQYFAAADVVLVLNAYRVTDCTAAAKGIAKAAAAEAPSRVVTLQREKLPFPLLSLTTSAAATTAATTSPSPNKPHQGPLTDSPSVLRRHLVFDETFDFIRLRKGRDSTKISGVGVDTVRVSDEEVNLTLVEQLVEEGQLNAIAQCFALVFDSGRAEVERAQTGWMSAAMAAERSYPPPLSFARATTQTPPQVTDFRQLVANSERQLRADRLEMRQPSCYLPMGFTALPRTFEIAAAFNRLRTLRTRI